MTIIVLSFLLPVLTTKINWRCSLGSQPSSAGDLESSPSRSFKIANAVDRSRAPRKLPPLLQQTWDSPSIYLSRFKTLLIFGSVEGEFDSTSRVRSTLISLRSICSLPFSVRSQLMTLGWDTDQKEENSRSDCQFIFLWTRSRTATDSISHSFLLSGERTPVSLLSSDLLESSSVVASPSPAKSVLLDRSRGSLARRLSATQDAVSQPPVFSSLFVAALGRQLSNLIHDLDGSLAATSRETLLTIGREDPSLIARPLVIQLGVEGVDVPQILSSLRNLLSAQHDLPPAFSHFVFNHLAGLLKGLAKVGDAKSLETYSLVLPLMADLSPQVTELSIRELRRNKADLLCLPTGAFWCEYSIGP